VSFQPGHKEAGDLRRKIEECAIDAHRLKLSAQIESDGKAQRCGDRTAQPRSAKSSSPTTTTL
jgi:hypothetical protein